jgi:hypothetical protein
MFRCSLSRCFDVLMFRCFDVDCSLSMFLSRCFFTLPPLSPSTLSLPLSPFHSLPSTLSLHSPFLSLPSTLHPPLSTLHPPLSTLHSPPLSLQVPRRTTQLKIQVWGAGGGGGHLLGSNNGGGRGGGGGFIEGILEVTPGESLEIIVGEGGQKGVHGTLVSVHIVHLFVCTLFIFLCAHCSSFCVHIVHLFHKDICSIY